MEVWGLVDAEGEELGGGGGVNAGGGGGEEGGAEEHDFGAVGDGEEVGGVWMVHNGRELFWLLYVDIAASKE